MQGQDAAYRAFGMVALYYAGRVLTYLYFLSDSVIVLACQLETSNSRQRRGGREEIPAPYELTMEAL